MELTTCTRRLTFCAGHRVMGHENKCGYPHGHNYVAHIVVARGPNIGGGPLDSIGRVVDFSVIKERVGRWLDENWDHAFLCHQDDIAMIRSLEVFGRLAKNERPEGPQKIYRLPCNPTAENMAAYLMEVCRKLLGPLVVLSVKIEETENCSATVNELAVEPVTVDNKQQQSLQDIRQRFGEKVSFDALVALMQRLSGVCR